MAEPAVTRTVDVLTTDGTVLPFEQAPFLVRFGALCVDQFIIGVATGIMVIGALIVLSGALGLHVLSLMILFNFLLRNAYFSFFEMRGGGATPGKHWLRLRVISRDGGALQPEQVLVRNLTREFEIFVPMSVLAAPQGMFPDLPPWAGALCSLWLLVGALFPLFNPRRLRLGDLLGGTTVVSMPRTELGSELVAAPAERRSSPEPGSEFEFTSVQLGQYGIDQLQVLEDLLRVDDAFEHRETLVAVLRRVEAKIGWDTPTPEARAREFLAAFYAQLRRHLEQKALFGVRQQHKREGRLERGGRSSEPPG